MNPHEKNIMNKMSVPAINVTDFFFVFSMDLIFLENKMFGLPP